MVNKDLVIVRLDKLKEYLNHLEKIGAYTEEEYLADPFIYGSSERFLHLAIECVIDMGNHMISDMRYRKPETNRDIFEVLYENKVITLELKNGLANMASFRNILVHDYIRINRPMVYNIIKNDLENIYTFIKEIVKLL